MEGRDVIISVHESRIVAIEDFPVTGGWYEPRGWLPYGKRICGRFETPTQTARYLFRIEGRYVGPLHREAIYETDGRDLYACAYQSARFSVVLEISGPDMRAIEHQELKTG